MKPEKELRDILQDQDRFMVLANQFVAKACEHDSEDSEKCTDEFNRFYRMSLDLIVRENAANVFALSGSPIETIFLNSLILGFIKCDSLGLVVHPVESDTEKEISEFLNYFDNFKIFLAWYENKFSSFAGIETYLDDQVRSGKMETEERQYANRLMVRYHYLPLQNSYHLTIQPPFPSIRIEGKAIRPDMLFWIPMKPHIKVVVECDGFDYHSDKEKFTSDRQRDRALQAKGYQILRYSGAEIHNNPAGITADLAQFLWQLLEEKDEKQP